MRDTIHSSVEEQVAMFLHVVGHNQRFRIIHQNWRRSIETVSRHFKEVMYAIGELRDEMIKQPGNEVSLKIRMRPRWNPYFKVKKLNKSLSYVLFCCCIAYVIVFFGMM